MFISVQLIDHYYPTINIKLPVVNHGELRQRISDFIQKKVRKNQNPIAHPHLCKKLFQKNYRELVALPQRKLDRKSVSCGDLLVCPLSEKNGVVLCFIPSTNSPYLRLGQMIQQFQGKNYPNYSGAFTCLFSRAEISFLAFEEGTIHIDTKGFCTLQGFEIFLLREKNKHQMLFCQKSTSNLLIQSPCLMGGVSSDHILVDCVCKDKNFCFQIGVPVFSQKEVDAKVFSARKSRATALNLHPLNKNTYLRFIKIFPYESSTCHVTCFSHQMFLNLPFGLIEGGQLLFSQKKNDGILTCTIISNLFVSGEKKKTRNSITFHDWQIKNHLYDQTNMSTNNIICFSDSSVTIVRKGESKHLFVLGAQVQLICSLKGIWGICFSRDEASSSSGLQSKETTLIRIKKKPSFVLGQAPSHSEQSSLDCDPEEGPSQGARSRSDCDTFHKPIYSSIKPLALQSSMSMQPFDRGEQPRASSSSFVEPAKKRFRKEKPSQSAMDEARREEEARRACAESLMLLYSQEQPE